VEVEPERSRQARAAAEAALIRVVHHYGGRPEFVVIGGLVPELLCSESRMAHAGTTDVDVQVDLEIACGSVNAVRLEQALKNAEFTPTAAGVWRWSASLLRLVIKFELLADSDSDPAEAVLRFDACENLGAVNLRGTGFAARDVSTATLRGKIGDEMRTAEVNITGLAGFLLAKAAAARSRRKPKDWYDIAFVLLHNNDGGPREAGHAVRKAFPDDLAAVRSSLDDLAANFQLPAHQGPSAYAAQMRVDHPEQVEATLRADAVAAVRAFHRTLYGSAVEVTP
jgi:hypothetical protein